MIVAPAIRSEMYDLFTPEQFEELLPHVTAIALVTYQYSSNERPGANSPLHWMRKAVKHICPDGTADVANKRARILLGINLYGMRYTNDGGNPIIGKDYLEYLKLLNGRLELDEKNDEHFFEVKDKDNVRNTIFYPTLYSIQQRVNLARELGTGLHLWDLGQGLDYFYDLI